MSYLTFATSDPVIEGAVGAGTGSSVLLLEMETNVPALGAAWLKVTVQLVLAPDAKEVGLQANEVRVSGGVRWIVEV